MKRNKLLSRGTALLLALALTLGLCPVSLAAGRSLTLRSLEDLTAFAKNCASDRYSDGLTVRLAADIDAEGTAVSIPLFLGTFEGQGHSISGLRLTESNSAYGLFSRVETGAAVRDLTVEAEVTPSGEQSRMGGIAGENAGSIENCAFSGVVVGSAAVGGIAGYNEGTVQDCRVSGVIRGTQYTGGIAGQNAGTLLRCENRAAVNTTVTEEDITAAELEELESTLYRLLKREEVTETAVTTDTGGIAGFSTGVIQSCTNRGSVGYAHVGYNVGGIAGRQNGYLASCDNRGSVQGRKDVGGIVGQMVPDITLQFSSNSLDQLQSELNTLQGLIDRTLTDAQSASDTVSGHVARISDYAASARMAKWARNLSQEEPGSFTPLGPGAEESGSALNASLTGISSEISALNTELSRSNTALISDLRAVNAQFMKVMNLFLNVLNDTQNVNYEDVYEDVSDESLQSATRGKVLECANYGAVTADRNAGGIAGSMAIEYDLDPEDDLQTEGQRSTRFTYQTKAILLSCQNYGTVQAKKSCAGGITGQMDLGTVSQCGGWGDVESESGDYVGGVAGLSLSSIRGSWAKCALSGGRYVGGIAGSGSRVTDCLSLVEITEAAQQSGAIAGEITGDYQGNRFVSETLAGVDRVSLSGKAEAISYDQLTALASAPENFRRLTLRFVADGRTLKEQTFDYGASFPESAYPDAPEKDGCYVRWDRESLHELHFDTTVTAVYEPYVTTLSSDPQDAHPALLVEGKFRLGERMEAQQSTSPVPGSGSLVETWTLTLPEDGEASHTVRWRLPDTEETYTVYLKEDGTWRKTESETIGSYLRFDLPAGAQFAVASAASRPWQLWALAGAGCAGIAVVLLLFLRKRKTKGPKESECELQTKAR